MPDTGKTYGAQADATTVTSRRFQASLTYVDRLRAVTLITISNVNMTLKTISSLEMSIALSENANASGF